MVSSTWIASSHTLIKKDLISVSIILHEPLKRLRSEATSKKLHVYSVLTIVLCAKMSLPAALEYR